MQHWDEVEDWLRESAREDVVETGGIRPTLVGFAGERPLLIARSRPFGPSGGHAALIELLSLAVPLGADRLAVSIGGNAWSYAERANPAWPYARDDRRDICLIAIADDTGAGRPRCTLTPYEHGGNNVIWGDSLVSDEVEGWLVETLSAPRDAVTSTVSTVDDMARTAMHCVALGHELYIASAGSFEGPEPAKHAADRPRRQEMISE
jgi:hypothetical protein